MTDTSDDIRYFSEAVQVAADANVIIEGLGVMGCAYTHKTDLALQYAANYTGGNYAVIPDGGGIAEPVAQLVSGSVCENLDVPADVWGGVQAATNLAAVTGSLVSYDVHVKNWGKGIADSVTIKVPFNGAQLALADTKFSRDDMWVSELKDGMATIKLGKLYPKMEATGTIRFRVLSTARMGEMLTLQPVVSWDDDITKPLDAKHLDNTLTTMVSNEARAGEATLNVVAAGGKLFITGEGFAPGEFIDTWLNSGGDVATGRFVADADGKLSVVLNNRTLELARAKTGRGWHATSKGKRNVHGNSLNLADGSYRLVARGVYSYDTKVATFIVK